MKVVAEEGSFTLQKLNVFEVDWDAGFGLGGASMKKCDNDIKYKRGQYVSNYMRAVAEPILKNYFGQSVMDDLFRRFTNKVIESMEKENWSFVNLFV